MADFDKCTRCNGCGLVGGHLPAPCPTCRPSDEQRNHTRLLAAARALRASRQYMSCSCSDSPEERELFAAVDALNGDAT